MGLGKIFRGGRKSFPLDLINITSHANQKGPMNKYNFLIGLIHNDISKKILLMELEKNIYFKIIYSLIRPVSLYKLFLKK